MSERRLPAGFDSLEPFVEDWDLPGTDARYERRIRSDMASLKAFYHAFATEIPRIRALLDPKPIDTYSDEERRLVRLMMAFAIVGPSVVVFGKPAVPDCGSIELFETRLEPHW
ncbi:MAG TPA: hypothetical protein VJM11_17335 [Nevskiaceae bacterium]|nr:hypothetical protein [Nevskiaceae bacterium]